MVHTFKPTIAAILALSAAAPIFAAPLNSRVDSGLSSVNNRAPDAAAKETSSNVGPAVLNLHLAARGVEVEAGAKRGTAKSEGSLHSLVARDLLGRAVLAAISSSLRREPEFANALSRELATELEARSAISRAITGGGAGFAVPNGLTQHLNRAGGTPAESAPASSAPASTPPGWEVDEPDWSDEPVWSDTSQVGAKITSLSSLSGSGTSSFTGDPGVAASAAKPQTPSTPNEPPSTPNQSPSTPQTPSILKSLVGTDTGLQIIKNLGKTSRDLDADTLHLLGRNLENLFARSFGIDELD